MQPPFLGCCSLALSIISQADCKYQARYVSFSPLFFPSYVFYILLRTSATSPRKYLHSKERNLQTSVSEMVDLKQQLNAIDYFGVVAVWLSFFSIIFIISVTCILWCCVSKDDDSTVFAKVSGIL